MEYTIEDIRRNPVWFPETRLLGAVQYVLWRKLFDVDIQTHTMCMDVVKIDGLSLEFVHDKTYELCMAAVHQNVEALQYTGIQTQVMCMYAVQHNGLLLQHVGYKNDELCEAAVIQNGMALQFVDNITIELCIIALKQKSETNRKKSNDFKLVRDHIKRCDGNLYRTVMKEFYHPTDLVKACNN